MSLAGRCKLCLETKPLRKGHFMPAALYPKHVRKEMEFVIRGQAVSKSAHEMTARELCTDCERRLDQNGESEVLRHVAPKSTKRFPLHERLRLALPRDDFGGLARFAGYDVGLDMDRFAYFAMSIVWRRAAIDWKSFDGSVLPATPLGDFQEQIRCYLISNTTLPPDMVVLVMVGSDVESRKVWIPPSGEVFEGCINFRFLVRGIFFRVLIGYGMPAFYREICCTSPRKCVFYGDAKHRMPEIMAIFS